MVDIPFIKQLEFEYGAVAELSPLVRRVIARNPSAFTFHGTGTYIVGRENVAIIDPGPDDPAHLAALMAAIRGENVTHILVTHTHEDHSPLSRPLKAATGAPIYAFGPHPVSPDGKPEQAGDTAFRPDHILGDGDVVQGKGWTFDAVHTPGHISNHLCFGLREENALFSGDHVMGWSTSVISPPDGNMGSYFRSLEKLLPRPDTIYYPTHGAPIRDPHPFVRAFIQHRQDRERQIAAAIAAGARTIPDMVKIMYANVPLHLHGAAARSVLAHMHHMADTGRVRAIGGAVSEGAEYTLP